MKGHGLNHCAQAILPVTSTTIWQVQCIKIHVQVQVLHWFRSSNVADIGNNSKFSFNYCILNDRKFSFN